MADFVFRYQEGLDNFFVFPSQQDKIVCCMFSFSDSVLVFIARNSGIFTKFTTPRKQQKTC